MGKDLNRVINGRLEYERLREVITRLTALAEKTTQQLSDMPKAPSRVNPVDETWAKLIDYKASCEWQLQQYLTDCKELENELNVIHNPEIRIAMKYKYIDGMNAEAIANNINLEVRSVYRLLRKGRKIYEETYGGMAGRDSAES